MYMYVYIYICRERDIERESINKRITRLKKELTTGREPARAGPGRSRAPWCRPAAWGTPSIV